MIMELKVKHTKKHYGKNHIKGIPTYRNSKETYTDYIQHQRQSLCGTLHIKQVGI